MTGNNWDKILNDVYHQDYFKKLVLYINKAYKEKEIFPPKPWILRALTLTDYQDVKVVILGQDPYHGQGEACGLSFAVSNGIKLPPSLRNIYQELEKDLNIPSALTGDLSCWAREGVLLLNTVLTVEKNKPASMKNIGWEHFTDDIIKKLNERAQPIVFILWGNFARSKKNLITNQNHFIIESPHPSPFSCHSGFFGSKPFSKTNNFLTSRGIKPINWQIK